MTTETTGTPRRIRLGMVGGGPGSFIGPVHRLAARMDDRYEFVAGAFSSDPEKSRQAGVACHIDPARAYPSWEAMVEGERNRPDRIDAVSAEDVRSAAATWLVKRRAVTGFLLPEAAAAA